MKKSLSLCITCCDLDFHLLENLLNHFNHQSLKPNEIIISCSGLNDTFFLKMMNTYKNILNGIDLKYYNNPIRHIQSIARNIAAKISNFENLIFFDVDDIPHPDKLKITTDVIDNFKLDAVLHNYCNNKCDFPSKNYFNVFTKFIKNPKNTNLIVFENEDLPIHHSHILCKKYIFEKIKFNESIEFYRKEDGKFCQDILDNSYKIGYIDLPLVIYN